jgi:hypothetical protein
MGTTNLAFRRHHQATSVKRIILIVLTLAIALLLYLAKSKPSAMTVADLQFPLLAGQSYSEVFSELKSGRNVKGIVISNAFLITTTNDLQGMSACLIFQPEDNLVREMLHLGVTTPRGIPYLFMRNEKIQVFELQNGVSISEKTRLRVQNVKFEIWK